MKEQLSKEYSLRFEKIQQYRNDVWRVLIDQYFRHYISPDSVVLDLGCGWGEFINNLPCKQKYGMDLNPDSKSHLRSEVTMLEQDCSKTWELPDNSLDVVFTSNFFEHLFTKEALTSTLEQAFRCLKPGGKLIAMGPNILYVGHEYWDFYDHYLPLSHRSLCEGMRISGFEIESSIPKFLPYTMADGKKPNLLLVALYLHLPLAWEVLGKQFLVTGVKK